jgi:hypothetical protein
VASSSIFLRARLAFFTLNSSVDSMARYSVRSPKGSSGEKQSEGSAGAGLWGAAPALPVMKTPLTVIATLNSSSISAVNSL